MHKIPVGTEITTKELLLYDIGFALESVAGQGWYKSEDNNKRENFEYINLEGLKWQKDDDNVSKKGRSFDKFITNVTFGSLSL